MKLELSYMQKCGARLNFMLSRLFWGLNYPVARRKQDLSDVIVWRRSVFWARDDIPQHDRVVVVAEKTRLSWCCIVIKLIRSDHLGGSSEYLISRNLKRNCAVCVCLGGSCCKNGYYHSMSRLIGWETDFCYISRTHCSVRFKACCTKSARE